MINTLPPNAFPWTESSSIPRDEFKRPCKVCKTPAWCLCVSDDGMPTPHAIHAGRLGLKPMLQPTGVPGFFTFKDRADEA